MDSVVALMGWRIKITVESMSKTDFVYGLGNIALVADLEVWLGITVACLPTLTPLFGKYIKPVMSKMAGISRKHTAQEPLKQALDSVGSSEARRPRNKQFSRLDTDSLLELGEGNKFGQVETTVKSPNATRREGRDLKSDLNNIVVRHDIRVYGEPHK